MCVGVGVCVFMWVDVAVGGRGGWGGAVKTKPDKCFTNACIVCLFLVIEVMHAKLIHTYTHKHTHTHTHAHTHTHTHTRTHAHTYTHTCVCLCVCVDLILFVRCLNCRRAAAAGVCGVCPNAG